ncbi:MAG: phosphatidate cytidylyltransferase [Chloroflexi bacterium]|nr:phosphatidate cytidylyltransferase [Chloroflexota bacterium]
MNDYLAVLISFIYVFAVLATAEGLRRVFKFNAEPDDQAFTRKFVHIGVGMWAWGTAALFQNKWFAIIPPTTFVIINYISYRRGLFQSIESNDKRNLGTVYFPIAFVATILLFFDFKRFLVPLVLMPMTWGDAFAAVIGKRYGRHTYHILGTTRSLEGSVTMLGISFLSIFISALLTNSPVSVAFVTGLSVATLATLAEAISPWGLDNLLVPLASVAGLIPLIPLPMLVVN